MATIKINELNETTQEVNREMAEVKGGAWYAKFDGVDGTSATTAQTKAIIAVCDGSVRKI